MAIGAIDYKLRATLKQQEIEETRKTKFGRRTGALNIRKSIFDIHDFNERAQNGRIVNSKLESIDFLGDVLNGELNVIYKKRLDDQEEMEVMNY